MQSLHKQGGNYMSHQARGLQESRVARRFGVRFWVAGPGFESGSRSVAGAWVRGACAVQQASERAREGEREQGFSLLSRRGCFLYRVSVVISGSVR